MKTLWLFPLITVSLTVTAGGVGQPRVFVDVQRLAKEHPAWKIADRLEREWDFIPPPFTLRPLPLTPIPLTFALPEGASLSAWEGRYRAALRGELAFLSDRIRKALSVPIPFLLPLPPFPSRAVRWRQMVQIAEAQIPEWVRINLRLSFADRLPPEERKRLKEQRAELEAALQRSVSRPLPLPSLFFVTPKPTPPSFKPITSVATILSLISPPSLKGTEDFPSPLKFGRWKRSFCVFPEALRQAALKTALSFVHQEAKRVGLKVTFRPSPDTPDATLKFFPSWHLWLQEVFGAESLR